MRISGAFPSTYLKAADLQSRRVKITMGRVAMEDVGGEPKPILYFTGTDKGLVLNKTNANNIAMVYGDDTDAWLGHPIELFEAMVDFQGRTVAAIRVGVPRTPAPMQQAAPLVQPPFSATGAPTMPTQANPFNGTGAATATHGKLPVGTVIDDEIPF